MGVRASDCQTLAEYRDQVLGHSQAEVAKKAGVSQPYISQIELGFLPASNSAKYARVIEAYSLRGQEEVFMKLVKEGKRIEEVKKALRRPIAQDFPLAIFAASQGVSIQDLLVRKAEAEVS